VPRYGLFATAVLVLLGAVLLLLAVLVFQVDNLEQRFIVQGRQLRSLGEATDRLAGRIEGLSHAIRSGGLRAAGPPPGPGKAVPEVLHPDVPNFLEPDDFEWPGPEVPHDGTLTRGWSTGDPKGFNPIIENSAYLGNLIAHYVGSSIASRMPWTDPDRWYGDLAWRVEITDDAREFTIYLRPGVQWHAPAAVDLDDPKYAWLRGEHELTARDFVFTLDMIVNPQVQNGALKNYYAELESWEAIDDHTLVVRWKKKLYLNLESTLGIAPIPEFLFAYEEDGTRIPEATLGLKFNQHWYNNKGFVGTGPYRMASYEPGLQIRLVRSETYHGPRPPIREIVYPIFTDPSHGLLKLKARDLTFGELLPSQYREEILRWEGEAPGRGPADSPFRNGDIRCETHLRPAYNYLGWNADKPMFADKRVRRAMTRALNRKGIIENVYAGLAELATGPFLPTSPYNDPEVPVLAFDLDAARKLLGEAGWEDTDGDGLLDRDLDPDDADPTRTPFAFTMLTVAGRPEIRSAMEIFRDDLLGIGVRMGIESVEWSLMIKRMDEKQFDAFTGGWLMGWESDPFQLWHSSQADVPKGSNRVGFRNAEADALIEALRETFDRDERIRMFRQLHRIIADEQPYTFFYVPKSIYCWWKEVKGVRFAKLRPIANTLPWWVEPGS
jgi:peptide/nickel transport system substrate-binding protein